ncbi:MAG TPA: lipoyl(octanoyl) transferase LipB [Burkholderiales bacterium]|nr:lipoyl(octanoyl) transferase LipB [Burkholderiales bacterium]
MTGEGAIREGCGARSAHPSLLPLPPSFVVRRLGRVEYETTYGQMREFTATRIGTTPDELWLLEHPPVYTLGQAGKREHLLRENGIPVTRVDRGGQITYHGPGQVVAYVLVDLRRRGLRVKRLVCLLEQAVIDLLATHGVEGARRAGAPGVYVGGAKVAALGLRVRGGCTYHGLALNVDMDLAPFRDINPCGYEGLAVSQLADLGLPLSVAEAGDALAARLGARLTG